MCRADSFPPVLLQRSQYYLRRPLHFLYIAPCDPASTTNVTMISDDDLYRLAIFLGSAAMLLIILYHFLEVNSVEEEPAEKAALLAQDGKNAASK